MTTERTLPALSQSKQALMACPYLYRDRVIDGNREPDNPFMVRGIEVHDAIARYVTHLVKTKQATDYDYFDTLIGSGISSEAFEILRSLKDVLVIDVEKVLGVEMYLALDSKLEPIEFPEEELRSGHRSEAGVDVEGTLDYVQMTSPTEAEIFDWKSYFNKIDADTFQAHLYPLLLFKHYPGLESIRFVLRFVRYGTLSSEVTFTREQVPELSAMVLTERRRQKKLEDAAAAIEFAAGDVDLALAAEQKLSAMPGSHCAWCPKMSASIRAQVYEQIGIGAAADQGTVCPIASINPWVQQMPEDRVRYAVFMDACRNENAAILREYVKAGGPITIKDGNDQPYTAGYQPHTSFRFPAQDTIGLLIRWLKETGENLLDKVYVGSTELKPLLKAKKRAALKELTDAAMVSEDKMVWSIGKSDEDEEVSR